MQPEAVAIERAFAEHQRLLFGLCYRMTGSAADAEDIVQETFARAVSRPPLGEVRPWLVKVALNLARDQLRARKRRGYVGPWLPEPCADIGDETEPGVAEPRTTEGRYELLESVSMAFLLALEVLTPKQRAVLLLREVFDYSVRETAAALDMSEANVKTTLHRARQSMAAYDETRRPPSAETHAESLAVLQRFLQGVANEDVAAVEALLAESVQAHHDSNGDYYAARKVVHGPSRVARLIVGLGNRRTITNMTVRVFNGLPALIIDFASRPKEPPRSVTSCQLDADGKIVAIYSVLADAKLARVG